jgi:hypothetical protein
MINHEENLKKARKLEQDLADVGKIIEGGFLGLCLMAYPSAPDSQVKEIRKVFFAGAHHLFNTMISVVDPGEEITDKDLNRMALIQKELDDFINQFEGENLKTEGNA